MIRNYFVQGIIVPFTMLILLSTACTKSKKLTEAVQANTSAQQLTVSSEQLKKLASNTFGKAYRILLNDSKTAALVVEGSQTHKYESYDTYRFFVYYQKVEKVILEDIVSQAKLSWIDDETIRVSIRAGIIREDEPNLDPGYDFNINSLKRSKISN